MSSRPGRSSWKAPRRCCWPAKTSNARIWDDRAMDVVVRTLVDTAPGRDGLVRRRVEMPPGARVEAVAGPGGELWYVIDGAALLTAGDGPAAPIRRDTALWLPPGARYRLAASVHLPPGQQHCLENTGHRTLRMLGVFHPGGSPAGETAAGPG